MGHCASSCADLAASADHDSDAAASDHDSDADNAASDHDSDADAAASDHDSDADNAASDHDSAPSDVRLKRGMRCVARLENGIGLYRYRYLWSDVEYVGVLAQEVADVVADAVVRGNDGYLRVRYEQLGLSLMTWEHWLAATHERRSSIEAPSLAATSSDTSTRCTI